MNPTALTEMVARVFDDRYRVEELIGVGAISAVYSAYDSVEGRWVALKVFDHALASDDRFIERLLDAAEQAAVLNHPNIAEIYDWGVDEGPYIVSELCEGGSLASLLEAGDRLDPSQALVMTLECARALNYGHEQGALHCNLTPRNIVFSADQRMRITDYGLAKVLADAPVSQAERALENVRYASPEQARGRPVGESTDMYSLSLVVSEAVSGEPPTVADTVVGTLMERAEAAAELSPQLGGLLPPLERCGRVDPAQRPEAEELAIALLATAETMARPTALPLAGIGLSDTGDMATLQVAGGSDQPDFDLPPIGDNVLLGEHPGDGVTNLIISDGGQSDLVQPSAELAEPGHDGLLSDSAVDDDGADDGALDDFDVSVLGPLDDTDLFGADSVADVQVEVPGADLSLVPDMPAGGGLDNLEQAEPVFAAPAEDETAAALDVPERRRTPRAAKPAYEELEDDADDRLPWWPLALLIALVAAGVAAGLYFFALSGSTDTTQVPDLVGLSLDDVDAQIEGQNWQLELLEDRADGSTAGAVIAQSPPAGSELSEGELLSVTVSLGSEMVEIPSDIIGLTVEQAESRLGSVGLSLGRLAEENSEALASGLVIGLDEPTTQKPSGERVALRVSLGPEDRLLPESVIGMSIGDATSLLVGLRLQAVEEPAYSPDAPVGTVLASIPVAGEIVAADSAVTLIVSAGPEPVEMPDIVDLQLDEAIDIIEELGLIFVDTTGTPGEAVIGSLPPIGAVVEVGAEVTIILADPPEDDEDS